MQQALFHIVTVLLLTCAITAPARPAPNDHDILLLIPTPQQMLYPRLPAHYRAAVTLSGDIAAEIASSLTQMKFESPRFEEVMKNKGSFSLHLCNADYTSETREVVSGALNPADMIDLAVNSVVKYRDPVQFEALKKETAITVSPAGWNNRPSLRIQLTPLGKRFGYAYDDRGAYIQESWLTGITLLMDSTSHLVYEITCRKYSRRTMADQTAGPSVDSALARYVFAYDTTGGGSLPSRLDVIINDSLAMVVSAVYRREGGHMVFDSRSICYGGTGQADPCMMMKYGKYDFSARAVAGISSSAEKTAGRELGEAARLADKATAELKAGRIAASVRLMEKLVERYPQTPHAIQARKLLTGLPKGF